jgi:hypothetical protein
LSLCDCFLIKTKAELRQPKMGKYENNKGHFEGRLHESYQAKIGWTIGKIGAMV